MCSLKKNLEELNLEELEEILRGVGSYVSVGYSMIEILQDQGQIFYFILFYSLFFIYLFIFPVKVTVVREW